MADGGDELFLFGAILDLLDKDEAIQEEFSTVACEVSGNYVNFHLYLVYFQKNYGATLDCTVVRQQKTGGLSKTLIRRFQMMLL